MKNLGETLLNLLAIFNKYSITLNILIKLLSAGLFYSFNLV